MNYRQLYAIKAKNKEKILKICPDADEQSGIYAFTRYENGFKYAYIGQAKHLLSRLADHLNGYQHIDLSIKKHGLGLLDNANGWFINIVWKGNENELDEKEQFIIKEYHNNGYQLYNHTTGSQGTGKQQLGYETERKGYNQGVKNGYQKAIKEIRTYFEKYLEVSIKEKTNKTKERKLNEFKSLIFKD